MRSRFHDVGVRTFPPDDRVLLERVHELFDCECPATPDHLVAALEAALRPIYPRLRARVRDDIAGFGDTLIYVYRDGHATGTADSFDWAADPGTASLVTNSEGVYVAANEACAELFGRRPDELIGKPAGSFTRPDALVRDASALWRELAETGLLHSYAIVARPDGTSQRIEFVTQRDGDGPGRNVTYVRVPQPSS